MTLTTKTRISNRKQIWRHNSWWNLLGKLPMEWVTCLQNLWVEQKKKQENKQRQNLTTIDPFKAYRLGNIIFWYNVISLNDYAWEVRTFSQRLEGNSSILTLSSISVLFFKLGSVLFLSWVRQSLCINVGYLILDLNCFRFLSYHFRLSIFIYYFRDDVNKAF